MDSTARHISHFILGATLAVCASATAAMLFYFTTMNLPSELSGADYWGAVRLRLANQPSLAVMLTMCLLCIIGGIYWMVRTAVRAIRDRQPR